MKKIVCGSGRMKRLLKWPGESHEPGVESPNRTEKNKDSTGHSLKISAQNKAQGLGNGSAIKLY